MRALAREQARGHACIVRTSGPIGCLRTHTAEARGRRLEARGYKRARFRDCTREAVRALRAWSVASMANVNGNALRRARLLEPFVALSVSPPQFTACYRPRRGCGWIMQVRTNE